jgi:hypothetical protein
MKSVLTIKTSTVLGVALALSACGGGGDNAGSGAAPVATSGFTQSADWVVNLPATATEADAVCYDFDAKSVADCTTAAWDIKLKGGTRTGTVWTNSGTSASVVTSKGGTLGSPFAYTWANLKTWTKATRIPGDSSDIPSVAWLKDGLKNVFTGTNTIGSAAYEYGLSGSHKFLPNYRTFLITTDSSKAYTDSDNADGVKVFTLQVTGYYGGASGTTSGYPSLRFAEKTTASTFGTVETVSALDASNESTWKYYDLVNKTVVDVPTGDNWQIAFNRYGIKLNQGDVGTGGKVGAFLSRTPAGFYEADGKTPIVSKFESAGAAADTLPDLTASDLSLPTAANKWVKDVFNSPLNPNYTGSYPGPLNYGWFMYYSNATDAAGVGLGAAHMIKAVPENGVIIRSSAGTSYARVHLKNIVYADNTNNSSQQTWTFEMDIQPTP